MRWFHVTKAVAFTPQGEMGRPGPPAEKAVGKGWRGVNGRCGVLTWTRSRRQPRVVCARRRLKGFVRKVAGSEKDEASLGKLRSEGDKVCGGTDEVNEKPWPFGGRKKGWK